MNYEKILCEFQNFIKAYLSLEHKQHRILDLNLSEVHLLKVAEQNPNYTLIEYAEKLKVSRSAITQLVNLLEKKDCVKKKKANKKSFVFSSFAATENVYFSAGIFSKFAVRSRSFVTSNTYGLDSLITFPSASVQFTKRNPSFATAITSAFSPFL